MSRPLTTATGAGAALLIAATPASADFLFVDVVRLDCSDCMKTYRIYANFSDPTDQLVAVFGTAETPVALGATTPLLNFGGFFDGLKQEDFATAPVAGPRDSWVTIGQDAAAGNDTNYSPGFLDNDGVHRVIEGASFSDNNDGWFDANAGTPVSGAEILIAQFTFVEGLEFFTMSGNVGWRPAGGDVVSEPFTLFYGEAKFACPVDLDLSESVDFPDLLLVLVSWGPCPECCPADFDESGDVGIADLLQLLSLWGPCF